MHRLCGSSTQKAARNRHTYGRPRGVDLQNSVLVAVGLILTSASGPWVDAAERPGSASRTARARIVPSAPQLIGTVTYDTAVNVGFHPDSPSAGQNRVVGNRFDSALGGPLLPTGMVSFLTVFPANNGPQTVSIALPPSSMATAMVLDFVTAPLVAGAFNSVPFAPAVTVGPDFLGLFLGTFGTAHGMGLLGMSDMATMGQGYHAVQAFYAAGMLNMIEVVPNRNAMLRATGDILVPVELMDFQIR
jgi:hypothetical protein